MVPLRLDGMNTPVTQRRWRRLAGLLCAGASLFVAGIEDAAAATRRWDGSSSALWSDTANWEGDVAPVSGDDLVFPAGALNPTNQNDIVGLQINSVVFEGDYTITGQPIALDAGGLALNASCNVTWGLETTLSAVQTWAIPGSSSLTRSGRVDLNNQELTFDIAGSVSGSGDIVGTAPIVKVGVGSLTLSVPNHFGGITHVNGGYVVVTDPTGLGVANFSQPDGTVVNGGTLVLAGSVALAEEHLTLNGSGQSQGGALQLAAAPGNNASIPTGQTTILASDVSIRVPAGQTLSLGGTISGPGGIGLDGDGTLVLRSGMFFTGDLTIGATAPSTGTIRMSNQAASLPDYIDVSLPYAGATLDFANGASGKFRSLTGAGSIVLGAQNSTVLIRQDVDTTYTGVISGPGSFGKDGTGRLTLTGNHTVTGNANLSKGTVVLNGGTLPANITVGPLNATVSLVSNPQLGPISIASNSTLALDEGGPQIARSLTFTNQFSGILRVVTSNATPNPCSQLRVTGTVTLGGNLGVTHLGVVPHGFSCTIIDNDGIDPVVSGFLGLPEGALVSGASTGFRISYVGGDGNDVTLYVQDEPPTLDPLSALQIDEDAGQQSINLTINDDVTPLQDLVLTAQSSNQALVTNAGLTFGGSGTARTLLFSPVANAFGTSTITVRVTDGAALFAERTFLLTVNAVNDAPTITAIANQAIAEDGSLAPVAFIVDDVDDAIGDIQVTGLSGNQALVTTAAVAIGGTGANRTVALTPVSNAFGPVTITVYAFDGEATGQQAFALTIDSVNDAPLIAPIGGPITLAKNTGVPVPVFVNDVDTLLFNVTVTASSSNQQLVTDASMIVTGGPSVRTLNIPLVTNAAGTTTITVQASDGQDSSQQTFVIDVPDTNAAPTITAIAPQTINEDTSLAPVAFTVADTDTNPATLIVTAASSNVALVPNANLTVVPCPACGVANAWTIAATPIANAFGTTTITVTVSDGNAQAASPFLLTVNDVAEPPDPTPDPTPITYVLAEGATGGFFDTDLLIVNPNTVTAPITLTFLKEDGTTVVESRTVPAQSRVTIHVDDVAGLQATSVATTVRSDLGRPLAVERTMFWNDARYGGHTDAAVAGPSKSWVFGEGAQGFFDTYLLIANPNDEAAGLTLTFLREGEAPFITGRSVGPLSRLTIHANEYPELRNRSFGISVEATHPVNAERATYFGTTPARLWSGGQASAGVAHPSTNWFLAEGATGSFFDTFILLGNPGAIVANVDVQFLLDTGEAIAVKRTVPAFGRVTIPVDMEPDPRVQAASLSTVVSSDVPIVAERSMYWPTGESAPWGEAHHAVGLTGTATRWALAEGRAGGAFDYVTYILLANPSDQEASVTMTFLRENGAPPIVRTYSVAPTSRVTINAGNEVEALRNEVFGATIEVTNGVGIAVERAMYWTSNGIFLAGGTGAAATRLP
jgi:autotransporter-associated beta strand protein